ncbi:hypothetical protein K438DRAFT_1763014 [Mycena galopus ATCC 62051]|nr:hypothetical protein K438DRAFT_1763014 [Mycena galopus ATCC 62051]
MYLSISVRQLIYWIFTTNIPSVSRRVSFFMGFNESESTLEGQFGSAMLFGLWRDRVQVDSSQLESTPEHIWYTEVFLAFQLHLRRVSSRLQVNSSRLESQPELQHRLKSTATLTSNDLSSKLQQHYPEPRIKMKTLTIHKLRTLLHPQKLIQVFKDLAPFMWQILHTFCASPNNHRRRQRAEIVVPVHEMDEDDPMPDVDAGEEEDWTDDPNLESGEVDPNSVPSHWSQEYAGFARNPVFAILLCLSMLVFIRNRATNVLPLILGLFFKISGTSASVIQMLSNAGVCVSGDTIERLKERVSEDAISLAVELITSGRVFFTIFDNINIFLRKSQQRLSNTNNMINATNCAIISINSVDPFTPTDLAAKLALRGNRAKAKPADILPMPEDDEIVGRSFTTLIAEMIVAYCPGSNGRPFGLFDVNEGSKKGVVKVLQSVQERSTLSQKTWSSISRILVGDWLTSNKLRAARRDRTDDINAMERLEYAEELSAPWHFALKATHMLMRTHYGQAVEDPESLAAHKGLLNRKWDVNKPNYAAAKSLIRHFSRSHIALVLQGFTLYSELAGWTPTLQDIQAIALVVSNDFATATAARKAQSAGDDWMAHSIYFIRDSLFFMLFEKAVSFADAGQLICALKYWGLDFRGVGQHNYACECAEVLSWFVNRFGKPGRFIPSDLYLEQLNFRVKVKFHQDIEALISEMQRRKFYVTDAKGHFVPAPPPKKTTKKAVNDDSRRSAITDIFVKGAEEWNSKFEEFIRTTPYDKELG